MARFLSLILRLAVLLAGSVDAADPAPLIQGLDHTPVAVSDLDKAAEDFARLGFAIKPGRPHDDGIRNRHIKFANGGEIELITATAPTDALARDYVDWLRGGEGPAFWSLYSPDLPALTTRLSRARLDPKNQGDVVTVTAKALPHRLFFADRLRSPTDGPLYWRHPNTAYRLARVWITAAPGDLRLMTTVGVKRGLAVGCAPFDRHAVVYVTPGDRDEVAVSRAVDRSQERSLIGVTVLVGRLAEARRLLEAGRIGFVEPQACRRRSLWIAPTEAHGLWLELYEPQSARAD